MWTLRVFNLLTILRIFKNSIRKFSLSWFFYSSGTYSALIVKTLCRLSLWSNLSYSLMVDSTRFLNKGSCVFLGNAYKTNVLSNAVFLRTTVLDNFDDRSSLSKVHKKLRHSFEIIYSHPVKLFYFGQS